MAEVVQYTEQYSQAWSDYVERSPKATVAHEIGWRRAIAKGLGHKPHYFLAMENNRVRGILPLFEVRTWWRKRYLVSLPWIDYGGICADDIEIARLLLEAAQQLRHSLKAEFVELRSVEPLIEGLPTRSDKVTFLLELDSDSQTVWKRFDAKLRNLVRKAQKCQLSTQFGGVEALDSFYRVFACNMRDLGTPVWGKPFFHAILDEFSESARIVLVNKGTEVIAGGLVLTFKDRLYVPSASAYRAARQYAPNYALYWAVIEEGCRRGLRFLDFGRSTWHSSTFDFKRQWTEKPVQLNWQYVLRRPGELPMENPANPKYRLMISLWKKLPLTVANFLGPRVIRNFP